MVTLSRVISSCGSTVSVTTRVSILNMRSTSGMMKFRPGVRTPTSRPKRSITPPSYCFTIRTPNLKRKTRIAAAIMYFTVVASMPASPDC